jgi:glycosyltransferase involved in cell wall biosynthesis
VVSAPKGKNKMHILFLTDNFPPEGNAPATRLFEHAIRWVREGHQVTVITGVPNFPEGVVFEGYTNRWYQREQMVGINVVRVKTFITANEGFVRRILDYMSFMVSGFFAGLVQKKPDIIVATSPQFFNAVGGWALSAVRRKPFIFELRDIWPASITAVGAMQDSKLIKLLERLEMFLYRKADRIISVTESFRRELIDRGIDGAKIDVVLNGVDLARYAPAAEKDSDLAKCYGLEGKFVAGYIGTHGMAHGLEHIVDAAELLQHRDDIRFVFAGGGAARKKLETYVRERQLNNVVLIPRQPKEMMPRLWSICDVSLVNLIDTPLFSAVIPSKIFESMGMGIPMVVSMPAGEATVLVREAGAGVIVKPEYPAELATAVAALCDNPSTWRRLSQQASMAAQLYSRESMAHKMLSSFDTLIR